LSNSHTRPFSPSWSLTIAAVLLCALFIRLGLWQWEKGNARQAQWSQFSRGADKAVALGSLGLDEVLRFQRVTLQGRFDAEHQFLLDNRTYKGRAGYEVLTPLERPDGRVALVDRGWVPFTGQRSKLPSVEFNANAPVTMTGRTDYLPSAGLASGRAAPPAYGGWPKVTSYPTMSELATALARPLEPRILLLDPQEPNGYVRDWHPPGMAPLRHWSYAIQWWCFAFLAVVFWAVISRRKVTL
jgi:surfeit locus 1 family protein